MTKANELRERAQAHFEADQLMFGDYWNPEKGKGCSIGCHAHDLGFDPYDHAGVASYYGYPTWLGYMHDKMYELSEDETTHVTLANATATAMENKVNWDQVQSRMMARILESSDDIITIMIEELTRKG